MGSGQRRSQRAKIAFDRRIPGTPDKSTNRTTKVGNSGTPEAAHPLVSRPSTLATLIKRPDALT